MAIQRFWDNFVPHAGAVNRPSGVTPNDHEYVERRQRLEAGWWLTPKTVAGFDPADFAFLDPAELEQLSDAVSAFRKASVDWAGDEPDYEPVHDGSADPRPNEKYADAGATHYRQALAVLRPDRYADPDAFRIGKRVAAAVGRRLPGWVREVRFETGTNSVGQPAVWVWVTTADDAPDARAEVQPVEQLLEEAVHELTPEYWPYVSFRTTSEAAELGRVAA